MRKFTALAALSLFVSLSAYAQMNLTGNVSAVQITSGTLAATLFSTSINAQTGTTYTFVTGDQTKLVTLKNSSVAVTVPQAGTTGFAVGWSMMARTLARAQSRLRPSPARVTGRVLWC